MDAQDKINIQVSETLEHIVDQLKFMTEQIVQLKRNMLELESRCNTIEAVVRDKLRGK